MSCEHVTAYWMICLQLLLHPLGSVNNITAYWMSSNYYLHPRAVNMLLLIG